MSPRPLSVTLSQGRHGLFVAEAVEGVSGQNLTFCRLISPDPDSVSLSALWLWHYERALWCPATGLGAWRFRLGAWLLRRFVAVSRWVIGAR